MSGHNLDFTKTEHAQVAPNIDPTGVRLPPNFSVCILGASRGIGASIAYAYALAGADTLILAARSAMDLQDVTEKCRSLRPTISVCCEICDIVSSASVEALALRIKQSPLSRIDVVIVNSGFAGPIISRVTEGDPADWQRCMNVNTLGTYHAAHYLIPLFLDTSRGARSFVVISASAAWITEGTIANYGYCISRLAQLRLVEMIARQYSAEGLLSVGVHPGAVRTEMAEKAPEEFLEYLTDGIDLCGAFCVWLAKAPEDRLWLSGRFVSAKWDVEELTAKKEDIVQKNLLKADIVMS